VQPEIFGERQGSVITLKPTDLLRATGLTGVGALAEEIEREVLAMMTRPHSYPPRNRN
jgi:hypothetical protein